MKYIVLNEINIILHLVEGLRNELIELAEIDEDLEDAQEHLNNAHCELQNFISLKFEE